MSLKEQYRKEIVPELMKKMGYSTVMEVPRIEKVTLNMGVGEAVADKKVMGFAAVSYTHLTLPTSDLV